MGGAGTKQRGTGINSDELRREVRVGEKGRNEFLTSILIMYRCDARSLNDLSTVKLWKLWVPSYRLMASLARSTVSLSILHALRFSLSSCHVPSTPFSFQNGCSAGSNGADPSAAVFVLSIAASVEVGLGGRRICEGRRYSYTRESQALGGKIGMRTGWVRRLGGGGQGGSWNVQSCVEARVDSDPSPDADVGREEAIDVRGDIVDSGDLGNHFERDCHDRKGRDQPPVASNSSLTVRGA